MFWNEPLHYYTVEVFTALAQAHEPSQEVWLICWHVFPWKNEFWIFGSGTGLERQSNLELWCKTCDIDWLIDMIHVCTVCIYIIIYTCILNIFNYTYIMYVQCIYIYTHITYYVYQSLGQSFCLFLADQYYLFMFVLSFLQALKSIVETWLNRKVIEHLESQRYQKN